ncbi:hypothetical protein [Pedobacter miscanthi]|nr:hypothetical protein [Pedobacter miscanthi]
MENSKKTVLSFPGITVNHQAELMQNYVAESIIDVGHGLRSLKHGADGAIIFFIDKKGILTALISTSGNGSGWQLSRLSHEGCTATSFDFDYHERYGNFRLVFAQLNGNRSELLVSDEIDLNTADLLNFGTQLSFKKQSLQDPLRKINQITMDGNGVLFSSLAPNTDALYHYFSYGQAPEVYTLPENTKQVKQLKVGRLLGYSGVFVLYDMPLKARTMMFQSFPEEDDPEITQRRFEIDDTINCFDLLPDKKGNSVIYLAGKGIYRYISDKAPKEEIAPATLEYTQMDVAQNGNEVSIWVIGKKANVKGLYYINNQYYQYNNHIAANEIIKKWTAPIQMHTDISDFSSIRGDNFNNQLFLFGKANNGGQGLIHFWQDKISTSWQENLLSVQDLNSVVEISSYTVDLDFIPDPASKAIDDKISVSAEENTVVYINNTKYFLTESENVTLDFQSSINIMLSVDSLAAPKIAISADFLPEDIEIDPTKGIRAVLHEKIRSGKDLAEMKRPDGSLLVKEKINQKELDEVAGLLGRVLQESEKIENGPLESGVAATVVQPGALGISDMGHAIGDLWHSAKNGFIQITSLVVEKIGAAVTFVVEIGGKIIRWVADKVKAAMSFLERVWEKIKVFFKDLYETLAFLFDWDDIIETKRALKKIGYNYLEEAKQGLDSYKTMAVNYILDIRAKYEEMGRAIDHKYLKNTNVLDMMADNSKKESVDSRTNWLNGKKDVVFGNDTRLNSSMLTAESAEKIKSETRANNVPSDMGDLLIQLLKGQIGFGEFIEKFANKIVLMALDIARKITELFFDLIIKTVDFLQKILYTTIDIPLLSYLYKKVTNDDLSIADLIALVIAIPVTVGYKLAHNEAPFKAGDDNFVNSINFA